MKELFITWLFWNVVLGGGLLMLGCAIAARTRSPVRKLRLLEWTLLISLAAPLLASTTHSWQISLNWLPSEREAKADGTNSISSPINDSMPVETFIDSPGAIPPSNPLEGSSIDSQIPSSQVPGWMDILMWAEAGAWTVMGCWWLMGMGLLRRLWSTANPESLAPASGESCTGFPVEMRSHPKLSTPCAFGLWKWRILLPSEMTKPDNRQALQFALKHELSHLRHGHLWTWRLTRFAQMALWFQPAYWWLRWQVRLCQDYLADDDAASHEDRTTFAHFLLNLAKQQQPICNSPALPLIGRSSDLTRRISMLVNTNAPLEHRCPRLLQWAGAIGATLILMASASIRLGAQEASPDVTQNEDSPTAKEERLTYHCRVVVYGTETPIEGARVVVERSLVGDPRYEAREVLQKSEYVTDENGRYTVSFSPQQAAERYLYVELDVIHPDYMSRSGFGYSMAMIRKNEKMGGRPFFEQVKLHPAKAVTGRLVTPDGQPAPNVEIVGYTYPGEDPYFDGEHHGDYFEEKTAEDGSFRVMIATPGRGAFWFRPDNYAPLGRVAPEERGNIGTVQLEAGFRAFGKVVDADGQPVPNIGITVYKKDSESPVVDAFNNNSRAMSAYKREMTTDQAGNYQLPPVDPGEYEFRIRQESDSNIAGSFVNRIVSLTEDDQEITIQALQTVRIQVQNVDSSGNPVRGHRFVAFGRTEEGNDWFAKQSDRPTDGRATVNIPKGLKNVELHIIDNEHGSFRVRPSEDAEPEPIWKIELGTVDSDYSGIEVIRYEAPVILAKPVDEDGNIVENVELAATSREPRSENVVDEVMFELQPDGRWRSSSLLPDVETSITINKSGWHSETKTISLAEGQTREVIFTMKPEP